MRDKGEKKQGWRKSLYKVTENIKKARPSPSSGDSPILLSLENVSRRPSGLLRSFER